PHHHSTPTLQRHTDETLTFHTHLNTLQPPSTEAPHPAGSRCLPVDLPPRPWAHEKYWFAGRSVCRTSRGGHPLLGVHVEIPSDEGHVWQADISTDTTGWLGEHTVHGQPLLPVAAFAEMALAAATEALRRPLGAVSVSRLEVEQMLPLSGRTQVTTRLVRGPDNGHRVEIYSRQGEGRWCRHAVADVGALHEAAPAHRTGGSDDSGTPVSPTDFYTSQRRTGIHHGPALAALSQISRTTGGRCETVIVQPEEAAPHPAYRIHPVMLDAALQSLTVAMPAGSTAEDAEEPCLPVALGEVRVFADVGRYARCRAEVVTLDDDGRGARGRITLMDDAGTVTAEITAVQLRRMQRGAVPIPLVQKMFDTVWEEAATVSTTSGRGDAGSAGDWLVLADGADARADAERFVGFPDSKTGPVVVADLADEAAVPAVVADAAARSEHPPAGVVVFVGAQSFDGTDCDRTITSGRELVSALSVTARSVAGAWPGNSPRLWVVTRGGLVVDDDEPGHPTISALRGLIRTWDYPGEAARMLADEPDLRATLVDVGSADDAVAAITRELAASGDDGVVAWRGDRRYVERLSRVTPAPRPDGPAVRSDGSYIVTGGMGGLGMVVARWLVDNGAGRVILNGRRGPADTQRGALADLGAGDQIAVVTGDISSEGVAERLVAAAEDTGLALRGVVHAAGVADDGVVAALSRANLERTWAPKAAGALRLHQVTADRRLDWWVGFSSVSSMLGAPGQAAYASANAWLDGLVAWRRATGLPAMAINWGQWSDVGMGRALTLSVLDPITPAEGREALESLVGGTRARVGVARLRLDRAAAASPEFFEMGYFAGLIERSDPSSRLGLPAVDRESRITAPTPAWSEMSGHELRTQLANGLTAILARELQMPPSAVDPERSFPELGLDSMMAMGLLKEARQLVGVELSATMLWNHPTIASLSEYLAEILEPETDAQDDSTEATGDSASSVLDALFDSVESASASSESGI
ncbi:type I polyketide synthase, partial [Mycolicibacterium litorale]|uniref:type I polyketide synthase n=1 Tax=Mycolicibacterium litorale TaxID=758802 RepID=UPI003CF1208B